MSADNIAEYVKDPAARLDYSWDWTLWLADVVDTIASATVVVPEGLDAVDAPVIDDTVVTQRVEGGAVGSTYKMVCQITTASGLIDERSIDLTIAER
ncbi:phage fiber-tail adaptor protein [Streptomyces sp. NPDC004082]